MRRCQLRRADPESHRLVDCVEYWAGAGNLTYAMCMAGNVCSRWDKQYNPAHDCLTGTGLRLWVEELVCSSQQCLVWLGVQCSSFVTLCIAQSQRKAPNGFLGDQSRAFVCNGNHQMRVASLLFYISGLLGDMTVLEHNPSTAQCLGPSPCRVC